MKFARHANEENLSVNEPIPGRNMVKNNAGGYVFRTDWETWLRRFLFIGPQGGSFYKSEPTIVKEAVSDLRALAQDEGDTMRALDVIEDCLDRVRNKDAAIFATVILTTTPHPVARNAAISVLQRAITYGTELFHAAEAVKNLRGWGRGIRNALAEVYRRWDKNEYLGYQLYKYRQRDGWSHLDVLRKVHANPKDFSKGGQALLSAVAGKAVTEEARMDPNANLYWHAQKCESVSEAVELIESTGRQIPWEFFPTQVMKSPLFWQAQIRRPRGLPVVAMMRNLGRMASAGVFADKASRSMVVDQIASAALVIHPWQWFLAMRTYGAGQGVRGGKAWDVDTAILHALRENYPTTFKNIEKVNGEVIFLLDCSYSMSVEPLVPGLSCSEMACAFMAPMLDQMPNFKVVAFHHEACDVTGIAYDHRAAPEHMFKAISRRVGSGGTDFERGAELAMQLSPKLDALVSLTDCESWLGKHGVTRFKKRSAAFPNFRYAEIAMAPNRWSMVEATDTNMLRVEGGDASLATLVTQFLNKEF